MADIEQAARNMLSAAETIKSAADDIAYRYRRFEQMLEANTDAMDRLSKALEDKIISKL